MIEDRYDFEEERKNLKRKDFLRTKIFAFWPKEIDADLVFSGTTAMIYPDDQKDVQKIVAWVVKTFEQKMTKDFNEYSGDFYWQTETFLIQNWYGKVMIANVENKKCKITRKRVVNYIYEADCGE